MIIIINYLKFLGLLFLNKEYELIFLFIKSDLVYKDRKLAMKTISRTKKRMILANMLI